MAAAADAADHSCCSHRQQHWGASAVAVAAAAALSLAHPGAAQALTVHAEPANALSLPTWAIHVSSVTEWVAAMVRAAVWLVAAAGGIVRCASLRAPPQGLMWRYAEVSGNPRWKGMTWGMMPALGSAMAACIWHFFYNSPGCGKGGGNASSSARSRALTRGCCPCVRLCCACASAVAAAVAGADLDFLVALQAFLTVVGNCTCWLAAYRIFTAAQAQKA